MSKAQRGDRSFQTGAGKGDSSRITNGQTFRDNYEEIHWGGSATEKPGTSLPEAEGWDDSKE